MSKAYQIAVDVDREGIIAPDPDGSGPLGVLETSYIYDESGRQTQLIRPDGSITVIVRQMTF